MGTLVRTWQLRHWVWTSRWELESLGGCRTQPALLTWVCGYWFLCTSHSKECQPPVGAWGYSLPFPSNTLSPLISAWAALLLSSCFYGWR